MVAFAVVGRELSRFSARLRLALVVGCVPASALGCTDRPSEPVSTPPASASPPVASSPPSGSASASASALPPSFPGVPPLVANESPPSGTLNYFEPHEMSAVGVGTAFDSCMALMGKTDAPVPSERAVTYCSCLADAWRINVHESSTPDSAPRPTKEQMAKCRTAVTGQSPYALPFPKGTPDIYKAWKGCLDNFADVDHGVYCGCYIDGMYKNPQALGITPADQARCDVADRYWVATRTHLTARQFLGIAVPDAGGRARPHAGGH
jgi:hypothetical protein